jgi:hypothetical protein
MAAQQPEGFPVSFGWIAGERRSGSDLITAEEIASLRVGACEGYPPRPVRVHDAIDQEDKRNRPGGPG